MGNQLGLQLAWLDDEPETIARAVSYLEVRNFVVDVAIDIRQFTSWVNGNGYDIVLTDLLMPGHERQGDDVIRELIGGGLRKPIMAVSRYLSDFELNLQRLAEEIVRIPAVDKDALEQGGGLESFRTRLLDEAGGGRVRVLERLIGYVEEDSTEQVIVCAKMPNGRREQLLFERETLARLGINDLHGYVEIKTIERENASGVKHEILLRSVRGPRGQD